MTLIRDHLAGSHPLTRSEFDQINETLSKGRYQNLQYAQGCLVWVALATLVYTVAKLIFASILFSCFLPIFIMSCLILANLYKPVGIIGDLKGLSWQLRKDLPLPSINKLKREGIHTIDQTDVIHIHIKNIDDLRLMIDDERKAIFQSIENKYINLNPIEKWVLGPLHEGEEYIPLSKTKESKGHNWGPGHVLGDT